MVPLGEVAEFINGVAFKPDDWHGRGLPIIRIQNLTDPSKPINYTTRQVDEKYRVQRDDLLVSWSATLGVFVWDRTEEALVNQHIFRVIPHKHLVTPAFLRHMLTSALTSMERHLHGATMKHVNRAEFLGTPIPLPSLGEQRRIAAILDHTDALRAVRRRNLDNWHELASSTFYEMFGDPVVNPKAWPEVKFADQVTDMQYGPRFYNESYSADGMRIVRITDLDRTGALDFDSMPRMTVTAEDELKYSLSPGDIIFARTGATVGKLAVIREQDPPCIAGAYFIRIQMNESVDPDYAAAVLRSKSIQSIIVGGSHQSAQQNFSGPGLRALPFPVPPIALQRQFASALAHQAKAQVPVLRAAEHLDQLFASLQSRAFRGEL